MTQDDSYQLAALGMIVTVTVSAEDGIPLLMVDTPGLNEDATGPHLRVLINDEPVYDNPPPQAQRTSG